MQRMINFDDVTKETINEHNTNWLEIPDLPYRKLITGCSRSVHKTYLCTKNPYESKW